MAEAKPFTDLLRQRMAEGAGYAAWLAENGITSQRMSWSNKDLTAALKLASPRNVQLWVAGDVVPILYLENLLDILKLSSDQRMHMILAAREQQRVMLDDRKNRKDHTKTRLWDIKTMGSPYRGMEALRFEHSLLHCGRDQYVERLAKKVSESLFVVVLGPSGVGKSSLVWAGLLPKLVSDGVQTGINWKWTRFTPGRIRDPVRSLAEALVRNPPGLLTGVDASDVEDELLRSDNYSEMINRFLGSTDNNTKLLLFVDQFEELFTGPIELSRRRIFIGILVCLIETGRVHSVATMRSEFIGYCTASEAFDEKVASWFENNSLWLTHPSEDQLYEMILSPAESVNVIIEQQLVNAIIVDTGAKPGNLPLMAFLLQRLFVESEGGTNISFEKYRRLGGVKKAIQDVTFKTFDDLILRHGVEVEQIVFDLFRNLVEIDEDTGAITRRIALSSEFNIDCAMKSLVDALVDARLLVRGRRKGQEINSDVDEPWTLEVAHESLFDGWPRLAEWIKEHKDHFLTKRRLIRSAEEWDRLGRPQSHRWSDEHAIENVRLLNAFRYSPSSIEKDFLGPVSVDELLETIGKAETSHLERATCGVRLAICGDPRPGVGLRSGGIPDISWLYVPNGRVFLAGTDSWSEVSEFYIAKYAITAAQFDSFVSCADGYFNEEWWSGLPRSYKVPGGQFPGYDNHPAINIEWSEAMAFCRWLAARTCEPVRLPTEREWRLAAGGCTCVDCYPWGSNWDSTAANTVESNLNRPVAVGLYPAGVSPCGACDMIGNVWEWCLDKRFDVVDQARPDGDENSYRYRSTCGGSWNSIASDSVIQHRGAYLIDYRNLNTGFRIVKT